MNDAQNYPEMNELQMDITREINDALNLLVKAKGNSRLAEDIQPVSSVLILAAQAAAAVFIAFERGYRMSAEAMVKSMNEASHD